MSGLYIGLGIGLGIFSSAFAASGLHVMKQGLALCNSNPGMGVFMCVFSLPFFGTPLIMALTMQNIIIPIIGYGILVVSQIIVKYKQRKNGGNTMSKESNTTTSYTQATAAATATVAVTSTVAATTGGASVATSYSNYAIKSWLDSIDMIEYYNIFITNGYETSKDMNSLTETDCEKLGIKKYLHVKKIVTKANDEKNKFSINNNTNINTNTPSNDYNYNASAPSEGNIKDNDAPPAYSGEGGAPGYNDHDDDQLPAYGNTYQ